jgi:hypothetical protein
MVPKPSPCEIKSHLIEGLTTAHRQVVALGDQEAGAVIRGDMDAVLRLEDPLSEARASRDESMRALREHIGQHGC